MEIGIDIGYGVTKAVKSDGQIVYFKSIVGVGIPDSLGIGSEKCLTVSFGSGNYTIGDAAEKYKLPIINVRKRNSIESIAYKALVLAAFKNDNTNNLNIVTGLPLKFYESDKQKLEAVFKDILPNCNVKIIPQPAGTFFDLLFNIQGEIANREYGRRKIGIIDIGTYTTDLLIVEGAEPIREMSDTLTIGIDTLIREIIKECSQIRRNLTQKEVESAFKTGYISKYGENIYIADIIEKNKALIAQNIWSYVTSLWGTEDDIDEFVLSGGGAFLLKDSFPQPNVTVPDVPFLSNAYGFYKFAKRFYGNSRNKS